MALQTEGTYAGDWLKYETPNLYSRETITVLAGSGATRPLTSGMVLSKVTIGTATSAAFSGNTGNGTMGSVTVSAGAKVGAYKLVIIEPGTNVGTFTVEDPDGVTIGRGTVASAFSASGIAFTLADGATDFAAGDGFTITVAAGSGKWVQYLDTGGATGLATPAGILLLDVTAADGTDALGVAIVRDAIVSDNGIVWPSSADSTEKAAAVAVLKTLGILVREGA